MEKKRIPIEELLVKEETSLSELGTFLVEYINYYADCYRDVSPGEVWKVLVSYVNISLQKKFLDDTVDTFFFYASMGRGG